MKTKQVIKKLTNAYPEFRQYHWDNSGAQIKLDGDVDTIALALDPTIEAVREARQKGAQLLLTHHPLFFKGTHGLSIEKADGEIAIECIKNGISLYSMHTSYDNHPRGMGYHFMRALDITDCKPLKEVGSTKLSKVTVFCPPESTNAVAEALAQEGAGSIGAYKGCEFRVRGQGSFEPCEGAVPTIGEVGKKECLAEERLEMIFPSTKKGAIIQAIMRKHPYESPAYDIYQLENRIEPWGCGVVGKHHTGFTEKSFLKAIHHFFMSPPEKIYGSLDKPIQKIGFVGGAGSDFIRDAVRARCDVYITGEVRYHDLEYARATSTAIIQMGHGVSERPAFYACADDVCEATGCRVVICEDCFETF